MNVEILQRMSTDGLKKLEAAVKEELERRLDTRIMRGRTGSFTSTKGTCKTHRIIVDSVNIKTITVTSLDDGSKWRVSPNLLKMDPIERHAPLAASKPLSSKPSTSISGGAWG